LVEALYHHLAVLKAERARTDAAGQESKTQVRLLFDAAFDGMILHDERAILAVNPAYIAMSGFDEADLENRRVLDLVTPESRASVVAHLLSGTGQPCQVRGVRKDGATFPAVLRTVIIPCQGRMVHVTILRDPPDSGEKGRKRVTEQSAARTAVDTPPQSESAALQPLDPSSMQIRQVDDLKRLAGGIAHEFNNLLTVILGFSTMGIRSLAADHPVSFYLQEIQKAGERATDLIQRLLAFDGEAEESIALSSEALPGPAQPGMQKTILLVEDESEVRRLLAHVLQVQGYSVLEAATGLEALRIVETQGGQSIDFVVTDVVMPQMSGNVLAERLRADYPHIRVLLISGYSVDELVQQGISDTGILLLQKPFTPDELVRKVRELLDAGPSGDRNKGQEPGGGSSQ
jgi:PAS domain S-box-containing protein